MVRLGNMMMIDDPKDQMLLLEAADLEMLLAAPAVDLPGRIMRLNAEPRYHNRLNAICLAQELEDLRRQFKVPEPTK